MDPESGSWNILISSIFSTSATQRLIFSSHLTACWRILISYKVPHPWRPQRGPVDVFFPKKTMLNKNTSLIQFCRCSWLLFGRLKSTQEDRSQATLCHCHNHWNGTTKLIASKQIRYVKAGCWCMLHPLHFISFYQMIGTSNLLNLNPCRVIYFIF